MKPIYLLLIGAFASTSAIAEPQPTKPSGENHGAVFQPARAFSPVASVELKYAPVESAAQALASITQKEVFVSASVQNIMLPHFEMIGGDSALTAKALIQLIESQNDVCVVEIGTGVLAVVRRSEDPIKRK